MLSESSNSLVKVVHPFLKTVQKQRLLLDFGNDGEEDHGRAEKKGSRELSSGKCALDVEIPKAADATVAAEPQAQL